MYLNPTNNAKNQHFEKMKKKKKHPEISVFYTCVPKMMIICFVPEIWSERDIIFCHFGNFFAPLPPNNPDQNFEEM